MTAKHYSIVAQWINYFHTMPLDDYAIQILASNLALHDDNFNKDKFLKECGL